MLSLLLATIIFLLRKRYARYRHAMPPAFHAAADVYRLLLQATPLRRYAVDYCRLPAADAFRYAAMMMPARHAAFIIDAAAMYVFHVASWLRYLLLRAAFHF